MLRARVRPTHCRISPGTRTRASTVSFPIKFSSLRGNISGQPSQTAGVTRTGLFTREVQVGATVHAPSDEVETFLIGFSERGTQNANATRLESAHSNTSILFGGGKRVNHRLYAGFIGGYTHNEAQTDRLGSLLTNEAAYFGLMLQYEADDWFANLVAAYGYHDMESNRRDLTGSNHPGDSDGHQGILYTQVGRNLFLGKQGQLRTTPYFGFALSSLGMHGFSEMGPSGTSLRYSDQDLTSFQTVVGVNLSTEKDTRWGWIAPKFDAAWWHSFDETGSTPMALTTPGLLNAFTIFSPTANDDRGVFQLGMDLGFDRWEDWTFNASYYGTVGGDGYAAHGGSIGATFTY